MTETVGLVIVEETIETFIRCTGALKDGLAAQSIIHSQSAPPWHGGNTNMEYYIHQCLKIPSVSLSSTISFIFGLSLKEYTTGII